MSAFHNSIEGEKLAKRFHYVCAVAGFLHLAFGAIMIGWHVVGAKAHDRNMKRLKIGSTSCDDSTQAKQVLSIL